MSSKHPVSPWTDERVEQLRRLHERGCSATEIAEKLGLATRNQVIGKLHRLGLSAPRRITKGPKALRKRRSGADGALAVNLKKVVSTTRRGAVTALNNKHKERQPFQASTPQTMKGPSMPDHVISCCGSPKTIMQLDSPMMPRMCRYIVAEPCRGDAQYWYCSAETVPGISYCSAHAELCGYDLRMRRAA